MTYYDYRTEISNLGSLINTAYFKSIGSNGYPVDPELIASKYFGLQIQPVPQIMTLGVRSGLDATQRVLFIDEAIYMDDATQHISRQSIAHELAHIIYDNRLIRSRAPGSADEAYELHSDLADNTSIETRANMLAGAILVPRHALIKQALGLLAENLQSIQGSNPQMAVGTLISALGGTRLTRFFGVSEEVIAWRLKLEEIYQLLAVEEGDPISQLNLSRINRLLGVEEAKPTITERVKRLIPQELLEQLGNDYA
jgi:hypothetical protein